MELQAVYRRCAGSILIVLWQHTSSVLILYCQCTGSVLGTVTTFDLSSNTFPQQKKMFLFCFVHDSALLTKFFAEALFRTSALECLTEIAGLVDLDPRYNPLQQQMFVVLVKQVNSYSVFLLRPRYSDLNATDIPYQVYSSITGDHGK